MPFKNAREIYNWAGGRLGGEVERWDRREGGAEEGKKGGWVGGRREQRKRGRGAAFCSEALNLYSGGPRFSSLTTGRMYGNVVMVFLGLNPIDLRAVNRQLANITPVI